MSSLIWEARTISGKGTGLVACVAIAEGTRILVEEPLLKLPEKLPVSEADGYITNALKSLPKDQQRQFFSLHNSYSDKNVFRGIFKTNSLPCGPEPFSAVYPTICLINHDCIPNTHHSWNKNLNAETVHATRSIAAGEEITIAYIHPMTTTEPRRSYLKEHFSFDCFCKLCSCSVIERLLSDARRIELDRLTNAFFAHKTSEPEEALLNLRKIILLLKEVCDSRKVATERLLICIQEYNGVAQVLESDVYHDAVKITIIHGDQAQAIVFAERGYKLRVVCTGEDGSLSNEMKLLMNNPASHHCFEKSKRWKSAKEAVPRGMNKEDFEKWLWGMK